MRKVFQEFRYKRYSRRKSERLMRRRVLRNKINQAIRNAINQPESDRLNRENKNRAHKLRLNLRKKREETLEAPKIFSLIDEEDPFPTFSLFSKLWIFLEEGVPIIIDLSKVEKMTPEVILYLLSIMEIFSYRKALRVRGNCPENEECKKVFQQSGFYKYVHSNFQQKEWNDKILTVKHGKKVFGETANEAREFARHHLPQIPEGSLKASYRILTECMGNTKEHAYGNIDFPGNWWLMAYAREDDVFFCILDNGKGIPKTMRKRWLTDRILSKKESELISSAMQGAFQDRFVRASSGKRTRGKGLPAIYRPYASGIIKNLTVISGKGFLSFGKGIKRELDNPFIGTLVSWILPKGFMGR